MDEELVRGLLRGQHPDLAGLPLRRVAGGWDFAVWRLGAELAVRLPLTERAPGLLRTELRWLPGLAQRLPIPVPVPVRAGAPDERFPRPWTVTAWVDGRSADLAPVTDPRSGRALADFLQALHVPAPDDAPTNPHRGGPLVSYTHVYETRRPSGAYDRIWQDALDAPVWDGPPVWLHGDLHPANVITAAGAISGVVDWAELCAGDPATDVAAYWLLTDTAPDDSATTRRARGWALLFALALLGADQPGWKEAGRRAIGRLTGRP